LNILFLKKVDTLFGSILTRILPRPKRMDTLPSTVLRFLLIRPGGIGDAVLLVPAIRALRRTYPQAVLHVLAERRNASIFQMSPEVDNVLCYDRPRGLLSAFTGGYDVIIDSEQWHRLSVLVARLVPSLWKIGFATNDRRRLLTHGVAYSHDDYETESFFRLLSPLHISWPEEGESSFLQIPVAVQAQADEFLAGIKRPFVTLFPGASIPERRWGLEKFAALARKLFAQGVSVVVVGGADDCAAGDVIVAGIGGLNLAGKTSLVESAAIVDQSSLLVSGDSGILHLGVGLGKSTVSLFGPGIAEKWAPRGERHRVINNKLPCSPCTKFGTTPKCPIDAKCMQDISVDEVFETVMALLKRTQAQKAD
jgi:lipopolysaccharide heptosyltransferase II